MERSRFSIEYHVENRRFQKLGGNLSSTVGIAGTPAEPRATGRLTGDDLPQAARDRLIKAVEDSKQDGNARDRSWTLRRGLDSAFRTLQAEAAEEVRPGSRLAPRGAGPR